jgi:hypothetical protein
MRIFILLLLVSFLTACTVSVPSADEQKQLVQDKTFVGGTPPWFVNAAGGVGAVASNGIIPPTIAPIPSLESRTADVQYPILVRSEEIAKVQESKPVVEAKSALDRIADQCPGTEKDVNAALTNIDRDSKIKQYESLTKKCPMSADLQLLLSQEYLRANKLVAARTGFEQVLVLDPTNAEAKVGISKSEKLLSEQ